MLDNIQDTVGESGHSRFAGEHGSEDDLYVTLIGGMREQIPIADAFP